MNGIGRPRAEEGGNVMKRIIRLGPIRVSFVVAVLAGVLAVSGCIFGPDPPKDDDVVVGNDTPAGVVKKIDRSYQSRDIYRYKECLSPEFTFYFDQKDIGEYVGDYEIPPSWGYEDETDAVENMFDEVHSIDITLGYDSIGEPLSDDTEYYAQNVEIYLLVMVDSQIGYLAEGLVNFKFESYTNEKDEKQWWVKDWRDFTA